MTVYDGQQTTFRDLDGWLLREKRESHYIHEISGIISYQNKYSIIGQAVANCPRIQAENPQKKEKQTVC